MPVQAQESGPERSRVKRIRVVRIYFVGKNSEFLLCADEIWSSEKPPEINTAYIRQKMRARNKENEVKSLLSYAEDEELSQAAQLIFMNLQGRMEEKMASARIVKLLDRCAALMHMPTTPA